MTPFLRHRGIAAPLRRANIDTDMIIRIERLVLVPRRELGAYAFEMLRLLPDGSEDPDCPLNRPAFRGASILVAGRNFGCGSSREAAVWALVGAGVRCLVAPGFGDIFRQNCIKNGILPVMLDEPACEAIQTELSDGSAGVEIEVDLEALRITPPSGATLTFALPASEREQLLSGEDEVIITLRQREVILAHLARWEEREPWNRLDFTLNGGGLLAEDTEKGHEKRT